MDQRQGYFYFAGEISEDVSKKIKNGKHFSDFITINRWRGRHYDIFLIFIDGIGAYSYGIARKSASVSTSRIRLVFFEYLILPRPVSQEEILLATDMPLLPDRTSIIPEYWNKTKNFILELFPEINEKLTNLENKVDLENIDPDTNAKENLIFERDATNIALRMSKIDPSEITQWVEPDSEDVAPFLQGLNSVIIREDPIINHDLRVFGDWNYLRSEVTGAVNFAKEGKSLTIMNVNRLPLEETFGVDLIYYFHKFRSYIMIQYKRKILENGQFIYRPNDDDYEREMTRMEHFCSILNHNPSDNLYDYRLNSNLFFFKFCNAVQSDPRSSEMIIGEYYPLELWKSFINSPYSLGPRSGILLSDKNSKRHLSNSKFISLAEDGWIGTRMTDESLITNIIRTSLENNRSVMLANNKTSE
ncbi:MAG: hypothetical protein HC933_20280 [Pleurocapsa sp. SU_196_0]|nr:hypothetical protein [Pleurocapsa sp. SU_196_0]